ncbi:MULTISPECIES: hypothetical protein [Haloarcula]|uniref:Uncharacterized protein n=1 Tax=Haloarcula pellucida TaxID=1427151 RepID=A0A830GPE7_9EURY|nr:MULTISPECIES: hypothetical protein [Halomicroarcula]MBX0350136.1 hypothetical protein [Halomicroarcula pellucida]MDS0277763.1 hypothetical protein [Halomicroarcula sp. S1AR25-4]GGO00572.1 hypothetical protein GCM10009030_33350 [Halomicroarcula pellucida]
MAGILDAIYLVLAVGVAVVGLGALAKVVSDTEETGSRWLQVSAMLVALVFLLALGVEFLA